MDPGLPAAGRSGDHVFRTFRPYPRRKSMIWQTPQAQDFRFGFEITMYVAAR